MKNCFGEEGENEGCNGVELRNVTEADAFDITRIYNHYIEKTTVSFETEPLTVAQMRQRIKEISENYPYFVATEGGKTVGYCYAHPWKERMAYRHTFEVTIYLEPSHKAKGIGGKLMKRLIEACKNKGNCHSLIACITEENTGSVAFHSRMGFKKVSLFKEVGRKFDRWLDVVDMEMILH